MTLMEWIQPVFVEFIPSEKELVPGELYISEKYGTTEHLCADGCGRKVVLPLTPAKWHLQINRDNSVSLHPSVGNWDLPCRSHYWIRDNRILQARAWNDERIDRARINDQRDIDAYFERTKRSKKGLWARLFGR